MNSFLIKLKNKIRKIERRRFFFSFFIGIFYSSIFIFGAQLNNHARVKFSLISCLLFFLFLFIITLISYKMFNYYHKIKTTEIKIKKLQIFLPFLILSLILLLGIYPGNFCYDSVFQYHAYHADSYTTHYPVLFCFIYGIILDFGNAIFGNYNIAQAIFVLIQAIFINFVITEIIYYCSNKLKSKKFLILSGIFFFTHPLLQILMLSSCQDVIFGGLFALVSLEFLKMSEYKNYFNQKSAYLKIGILIVLMCLFRHNGFYALLPALIIGFISIDKEKRKKFITILTIPLVIFQCINYVIVEKVVSHRESIFHESLNVPIMQIARSLYYNHQNTWSNDLNLYFNENCGWNEYGKLNAISDPYKNCLKDEYLSKNFSGFLKYWKETGLKNPLNYIEATGLSTLGLFYPWTNYPKNAHYDSNMYHPYIDFDASTEFDFAPYYVDGGVTTMSRRSKIPFIETTARALTQKQLWSHIPGFRLFWGGAFSTMLIIISILFVLYRRQKHYLMPIGLIFGLVLTVFLSPVILFRYLFPVVLTTPILFYIIVKCISVKRVL